MAGKLMPEGTMIDSSRFEYRSRDVPRCGGGSIRRGARAGTSKNRLTDVHLHSKVVVEFLETPV
jgi:hypothetical protein